MHCKGCEYPLWDLKARVCPECGLGFSPVDYEFVVNSVRFMCPHCRQAYYGTGEKGHLVPRRFACVKCAAEIDEAEMVLLPTAGVTEVQTVGGVVAWRERAKRGRLWAFFSTIGQASFTPHRLARFCGEHVNWVEAWVFGGIATGLFVLMGVGWLGVMVMLMQGTRMGMQGGLFDTLMIVWDAAKWVLYPLVGMALMLFAWAGSAHLVLRVGNPKPVAFAKTLECFGYSCGAGFLMAVPCLGFYASPLAACWVCVSVIIQLHVRHGVTAGRAVWAGVLLPLVGVCLLGAWIVLAVLLID